MSGKTSNKKMVGKSVLVGVGAPTITFGIEMFLNGQRETGAIAIAIGFLFIGAFVYVNERDIPYEEELLALLKDLDVDEEDTKSAAEELAKRTEGGNNE